MSKLNETSVNASAKWPPSPIPPFPPTIPPIPVDGEQKTKYDSQSTHENWYKKGIDTEDENPLMWPPGFAGHIARHLYQTSYVPVQKVSIAATLALLAGICARGYRTYTNIDLGLYLILVAKSGVGKDSIHEGIKKLVELTLIPMAGNFIRQTDFASGEALHKAVLTSPGFLWLSGVFGRRLKRMSNHTDTPMQNLRTIMTHSFGKEYLEGKDYSDPKNSMPGVAWPSLSFLGETTPSTFLECLTTDMAEDGFLSRFLTINYTGGQPKANEERSEGIDPDILGALCNIVNHMVKYQTSLNMPEPTIVRPDADTVYRLNDFRELYRSKLNDTPEANKMERQSYIRAHLKVLKVASLLAVADNYIEPKIKIHHFTWADSLIRNDIDTFQQNIKEGNIGVDDDARELKLIAALRDYLDNMPAPSYKINSHMRDNNIVTKAYLQTRIGQSSAFKLHRLGSNKALEYTIQNLISNGNIMDVAKTKLSEAFNFHGLAYRILKL